MVHAAKREAALARAARSSEKDGSRWYCVARGKCSALVKGRKVHQNGSVLEDFLTHSKVLT